VLVFDIETGPLDRASFLDAIPVFDAEKEVPHPGEFDINSVLPGNAGWEKHAAKVEIARGKHQKLVDEHPQKVIDARAAYIEKHWQKAALSPVTGQVLAIGILDDQDLEGTFQLLLSHEYGDGEGEASLLVDFWDFLRKSKTVLKVGFNCHRFDLPFLVRRSWKLGVYVPECVMDPNGRYFHYSFIDLMAKWQLGNRQDGISLADLAKYLDVGDKPDGISGKDFSRLYGGTEEEREQAINYLKNDLVLTYFAAVAMGVENRPEEEFHNPMGEREIDV